MYPIGYILKYLKFFLVILQILQMFRVVLLVPTFKFCGGDPGVLESAADKYAACPSGILITKRNPKDFRVVKQKNNLFFKQLGLNLNDYCVEDRGWNFETLYEAQTKLRYEAENCGHYILSTVGWLTI